MDSPETLEALQARHRKEQRDLIARVTQKKKSANKKTRKGVNDECDRLEQELQERQAQELAAQNGESTDIGEQEKQEEERDEETQPADIENGVESLSISGSQPDNSAQPPTQQNAKKKQNRAKARLARRAAEHEALVAEAKAEAAALPDLREQERIRMREQFAKYGLKEKEIRADGHCLYAAVADQMETAGLGLKPRIQPKINGEETKVLPYKAVRYAAADFIEHNPDDFAGFMEEPLEDYLQKIRDTGEWGGHMELMALAKTYGIKINVLHGDGQVDKIEASDAKPGDEENEIWLGYYRHSHGLGEHYNSLRKTP
ncbi:cysteine proteinase [Melanomma pulvis-pyrius CBS 109.77]|uniref:Cysteine proteinase n=1 Tax=Melanomma pulvis-pyrius CBS 109.77 TaxID=1314802 RepID=A0A6A6X3L9_9PLEO|nr:cysteine proteinase [Melanomma pulvis-pyrius CBS 109.77]